MPRLLEDKCSCPENTHSYSSNDLQTTEGERPFFSLNIGMSHLMPSVDILID
jgi:hypothetical protein